MKWHKALILAVVLLVLVLAYLWDQDRMRKEEAREAEEKKVFPWSAEQLTEVMIKRPSGLIRLLRSEEDWRIGEPVQTKADQERLKNFLERLLNAEKERQIDEKPGDLKVYGLEQPSVTITVKAEDTQGEKELQIGEKNPTEAYYYARLDEEEAVFLVLDSLYREATVELLELREKSLLDFSSRRVFEVAISSGEETVVLTREQGKKWRIQEPHSLGADGEAVDGLLSGLSDLEAVAFEDAPGKTLSELGLEPPEHRVVLRLRNPEEEKGLQIGREAPNETEDEDHRLYVRVEGEEQIALVKAEKLKGISTEVFDWRNKALLTFEPYRAKRFEIRWPDELLSCRKISGDDWEIESPRQLPANISKVYDVLWALKRARVSRFLEGLPDSIAWENPWAEVSVWLEDVEDPLQLVVAGSVREGGDLFAKASAQENVVAVDPGLIEEIKISIADLRDPRLLHFKENDVHRLLVNWEGRTIEFTRDGREWKLIQPEKQEVDSNKILDLLWDLLEVKFEEELDEGVDPSALGEDQPVVDVKILDEKEEEIGCLSIGKALSDRPESRYAWMGEGSRVYLLEEKVIEDLRDDLEEMVPNFSSHEG